MTCKRSRSFCQKYRWQVTAKHTYTLHILYICGFARSDMEHEVTLYGVHRTCAERDAVSCGTSHASAVNTPLRWIFKKHAIKSQSFMQNHTRAQWVCSRERRIALYKRSSIKPNKAIKATMLWEYAGHCKDWPIQDSSGLVNDEGLSGWSNKGIKATILRQWNNISQFGITVRFFRLVSWRSCFHFCSSLSSNVVVCEHSDFVPHN